MQFIRRAPDEWLPENNSVDGADVVVQIGSAKTGLQAAHLMHANIRISRSPQLAVEALDPTHTLVLPQATTTQGKALEALSEMQNALSPQPPKDESCGSWSPYSPDDAYPYRPQPSSTGHDSATLPCLRREPSDAMLPAYYDPGQHPYYISQQTSASAVRDMALYKGAPTIFENTGRAPLRTRSSKAPEVVEENLPQARNFRRFSTRRSSRSRGLDLVNLFPQPRSASVRFFSQSRLSRSPFTMTDFTSSPSSDRKSRKSRMAAGSESASGSGRFGRPFDEAILDQHKTNVRRPPKGIKNWFDAYLDEDDEEDDLADEVDEAEPQELPGDDLHPPAYTGHHRHASRAIEKSTNGFSAPIDSRHAPRQAVENAPGHARLNRSSNSSRTDSIQSSHLGSKYDGAHNRVASSNIEGDSIMSLSGSEYEDEDEDYESDENDEEEADRARGKLPAIRDSIFDDRNIMVADASTLDVIRVPKPTQLSDIRIYNQVNSSRSSFRSSTSAPSTQRRDRLAPLPPHQEQPSFSAIASDSDTLRRLNGLSVKSSCTTETTETSLTSRTQETRSSGTSYDDPVNRASQDALHMVAITEEERMLLEIMRQKRVAMQQMSFTEGYQLALRTEQQRLASRSSNAEEHVLNRIEVERKGKSEYRATEMGASAQTPTQESEMRRQLSAICKEQVDDRFQMERFLNMSGPAPLASHPPDAPQTARKIRAPSGEVLPATRYSPVAYGTPATSISGKASCSSMTDLNDAEAVRMRVKQFISSKGAVPPLDSNIRTMRRPPTRQTTSMSPSPVMEEDQTGAPPLPPRSPQRSVSHRRGFSNNTVSTLGLRRSSSSIRGESKDRSPVSALSGKCSTHRTNSPDMTAARHDSSHDVARLPSRLVVPNQGDSKVAESPAPLQLSSYQPRVSSMAASPFATLINSASRNNVLHHPAPHVSSQSDHPRGASSTEMCPAPAHDGLQKIDVTKTRVSMGKQPVLPRLDTRDHVRDARASMLSITSAGEEVLNAWAELGGGQDCLQTKVRHRVS